MRRLQGLRVVFSLVYTILIIKKVKVPEKCQKYKTKIYFSFLILKPRVELACGFLEILLSLIPGNTPLCLCFQCKIMLLHVQSAVHWFVDSCA